MNHDDPRKNAEEYARQRASDDNDRMAIKSSVGAWSDDFTQRLAKYFQMYRKRF